MAREVYLVGVGMGNPATLTGEAWEAIRRSGLLVGAGRLLEPFRGGGAPCVEAVRADDILTALHGDGTYPASVLFSGDVGFYSGATALAQRLEDAGGFEVRAIPGISSVSYFCARLLVPWQDAHLVSAHGREADAVAAVRGHAKTLFLTGGRLRVQELCARLAAAGCGALEAHAGARLSYDDETIVHGTVGELARREFPDLAVLLVLNPEGGQLEPGKVVRG